MPSTLGQWKRWSPTRCATLWRTSPLWVGSLCCSFPQGCGNVSDYATWIFFSLLNPDEPIWRVCHKDGWTDVCSPVKTAAGLRCGPQDLCPWRSEALLRHDGPPRKTVLPTLVSCKPDLSEAVGWKLYEMTRRFVSAWRRVRESWTRADTVRGSDRRPEEFPTSCHIPFGIGNCTAAFDRTEVQVAYSLSPMKNLQQSLATAVKPRSL